MKRAKDYEEVLGRFRRWTEKEKRLRVDVAVTFTKAFDGSDKLDSTQLMFLQNRFHELVGAAMMGDLQQTEMVKLAGILEYLRAMDQIDDDQIQALVMLTNRIEVEEE